MEYQTEVVKAEYPGELNSRILKEKGMDLIKELKKDPAVIKAAELLKKGEITALPTETVYGLAADAMNTEAVKKIFAAKGRPQDNPLIVHIGEKKQLTFLVDGEISLKAQMLIDRFWPGPLTIIFKKSSLVPDITSAGLDTVAVRMPAHPLILAVMQLSELALAAPSANTSGYPSPTSAEHVYSDLNGKIPLIIDGGSSEVGVESTVIDLSGDKAVVLRPGGITREKISELLEEEVALSSIKIGRKTSAPAPGMKYRHYAPDKKLHLFSPDNLNNILEQAEDKNIALIISKENKPEANSIKNIKAVETFSKKNPAELGRKLYALLRQLDNNREVEEIYIEEIPDKGIGEAVMNRIYKACDEKRAEDSGGGED
ncbi:MAG: L-threonylcarbamoyladenylate synthase [Halanaerobiales bacterium]|nr:L-threonylcarbamoyladenylate synthase [Halanaerobiales bacterium]